MIGPTTVLASDENARRMAWILDRYRDTDAATHAAIGIIVQDHFGRDRDEWARQMAVIQGRYPEIVAINRPARRLRARRWNAPMPRLCAAVPSW